MADKFDGVYDNFYRKPVPFEVPHYKTYSSIEGIWQLEHTRDVLAKQGLKDPWMRNEIWRYPKWYKPNRGKMMATLAFGENLKSLKRAFVLTTFIIICQNVYWNLRYGKKPVYVTDLRDWMRTYFKLKDERRL